MIYKKRLAHVNLEYIYCKLKQQQMWIGKECKRWSERHNMTVENENRSKNDFFVCVSCSNIRANMRNFIVSIVNFKDVINLFDVWKWFYFQRNAKWWENIIPYFKYKFNSCDLETVKNIDI